MHRPNDPDPYLDLQHITPAGCRQRHPRLARVGGADRTGLSRARDRCRNAGRQAHTTRWARDAAAGLPSPRRRMARRKLPLVLRRSLPAPLLLLLLLRQPPHLPMMHDRRRQLRRLRRRLPARGSTRYACMAAGRATRRRGRRACRSTAPVSVRLQLALAYLCPRAARPTLFRRQPRTS